MPYSYTMYAYTKEEKSQDLNLYCMNEKLILSHTGQNVTAVNSL